MSDPDAKLREAVATAMWRSEGGTGRFGYAPNADLKRYLGLADAAIAVVPVTPTTENEPREIIARMKARSDLHPWPGVVNRVEAEEFVRAAFAAGRAPDPPCPHGFGRYSKGGRVFCAHCDEPLPAATPDPPERSMADANTGVGHDQPTTFILDDRLASRLPAASPDERLREALAEIVRQVEKYPALSPTGIMVRDDIAGMVEGAARAALAAAARDTPDDSPDLGCPDGGTCHHNCGDYAGPPFHCWRVHNAAPLSMYGEAWPTPLPHAVVLPVNEPETNT